jgi:hypothetical protein
VVDGAGIKVGDVPGVVGIFIAGFDGAVSFAASGAAVSGTAANDGLATATVTTSIAKRVDNERMTVSNPWFSWRQCC